MLNVGRHWEVFAGGNGSSTERLWEASAVVQHHDAVAGTARQLVTDDYAMRLARGMAEADAAMQRHIAQTLTRPSTPLTALTSCPLLNYSLCDPTQTGQGTVVVLLYNPLARNRTELHSVPVQSSDVQVLDGAGRPVQSQAVQLPLTQSRTPQSAPYELRWLATVQGLGVETFFVQHGSSSPPSPSPHPSARLPTGVSSAKPAPARRLAAASASPPSAPPSVVLENECWALSVDNATGQVTSAYDRQQNRTFNFSLAFLYYVATDGSSHYSFEPAGDAVPVSPTTALTGSTLQGAVSREVQVRVSDWVSYTLRLSMAPCDRGGAELVVDFVVGPVPIDDGKGKEVIVRYSVPDIQSGAVFYTDRSDTATIPHCVLVQQQRRRWIRG
jgi:alpha-mannosidase